MSIFVFKTSECLKDVERHGIHQEIDRFEQRILTEQRINFHRFPPPYLKKRFRRQERLVAGEYFINGHILVVFYRVLIRGGSEYTTFLTDPKNYGDLNFRPMVTEEFLENWLKEKLKVAPPPEKDSPTEEERFFLWEVGQYAHELGEEKMVYESKDWVKNVSRQEIKQLLGFASVNDIILAISERNAGTGFVIKTVESLGLYILVRNLPSHNSLFLAGITRSKSEMERLLKVYEDLDKKSESEISFENILRNSARAYPILILVDPEAWIKIESSGEANLALSPEESIVLQSVLKADGDGYPLFINGGAGSGKTTILQYLFAPYMRSYLKHKDEGIGPPLYLTYSSELVKRGRMVVKDLLNNRHSSIISENAQNKRNPVTQQDLEVCFQEFRGFLLSRVDNKTRESRFSAESFIDYTKFKLLWHEKFRNDPRSFELYNPDRSWHIIRTYIKGYSSDDHIDITEFKSLPEGERKHISIEQFEKVFEIVWKNWYQNLTEAKDHEKSNWDYQDLVRYVLEKDLLSPFSPGIFCDESQDFTRIELELLFRLNLFSYRKLDQAEVSRVPFVFAGDPFQTLNPTGFRWEYVKSFFTEKILIGLRPEYSKYSQSKEINYKQLTFNYRSTGKIVKVANAIQALRQALFEYNVDPQTSWEIESGSVEPGWVSTDNTDSSLIDFLSRNPDIKFIVPCSEGLEGKFVENDPFLKEIVKTEEGVPENVYSPMRAKGLEFKKVAVYGFGAKQPKDVKLALSRLWSDQRDAESQEDSSFLLPAEYYLNQLYVAVTRAQEVLLLIDNDSSIRTFWGFICEEEGPKKLLKKLDRKGELWKVHIPKIVTKATLNDLSGETPDYENEARELEATGIAQRDSFLLRQAAQYYIRAKRKTKAHICRAKACEFQEEFGRAANFYYESQKPRKALENFFLDEKYKRIIELSDEQPSIGGRLEVRISKLLINGSPLQSLKEFLKRLVDDYEPISINLHRPIAYWTKPSVLLINQTLDQSEGYQGKSRETESWNSVLILVKQLENYQFQFPEKQMARILFRAGQLEKALDIFERQKITQSPEYSIVKRELLLEKLEAGDTLQFSPGDHRILANHFERIENLPQACLHFERSGEVERIAKILNLAIESNHLDNVMSIGGSLARGLIVSGLLLEMVEFVRGFKFRRFQWIKNRGKIFSSIQPMLVSEVVQTLAVRNSLENAPTDIQQKVSEFLRERFVKRDIELWATEIDPAYVAATFEKANRHIDTINLYEILEKYFSGKGKQGILDLLRQRRVLAILRHSRVSKESEKKEKEANFLANRYGFQLEKIPSLLNWSDSAPWMQDTSNKSRIHSQRIIKPSKQRDILAFEIGKYKLKYSPLKAKIQIDHEESISSARVDLRKKSVFLIEEGENKKIGTGETDIYGLQIRISEEDNPTIFYASISKEERLEIPISW